jgi:ABC-type transport system involved in multi-copper enzyme maturation permease subunit
MLGRMIVKEWKEKLGLFLFAMAGFLFFGLAFSAYSQDKEALDILLGTMTLVFVPIFSLLLGASAFSAEFRDDAWAYLFSRPARKWQIWLAKYVSLLSMLAVVFVVLALMAELHPALKAARQTFSIPLRFGENISFPALAYLLPLSLFTVAFSMSVLSEKPHVVVFLAASITYALHIGLNFGPDLLALLRYRFWSLSGERVLTAINPLIPLSFAAASILTLSKADFSQPGRRAWVFTKFAALFLTVSLGIGVLCSYAGPGLQRSRGVWNFNLWNGRAYYTTDSGIYRFDPATGKSNRLARAHYAWSKALGGEDKVVYRSFSVTLGFRTHQDIWIIDAEGKKPRRLIRTSDASSPLYGADIYPIEMSPSGDKIAFLTRNPSKDTADKLWSVNADGTGLKGFSLDLPKGSFPWILGFADLGRSVLMSASPRRAAAWEEGVRLLKANLDSGVVEILAEHTHEPKLQPGVGPDQQPSLIAYIDIDKARSLNTLRLLDSVTLRKWDVYASDSIQGFRWSPAGNKLAFVTQKTKIGIYFVPEDRVTVLKDMPGYDFRWPSASLDWVEGGRLLVRKLDKGVGSLMLLDAGLTEQKTVPLPFSTHYPAQVWGAGHYALVTDIRTSQLWAIDLRTDHWHRVY